MATRCFQVVFTGFALLQQGATQDQSEGDCQDAATSQSLLQKKMMHSPRATVSKEDVAPEVVRHAKVRPVEAAAQSASPKSASPKHKAGSSNGRRNGLDLSNVETSTAEFNNAGSGIIPEGKANEKSGKHPAPLLNVKFASVQFNGDDLYDKAFDAENYFEKNYAEISNVDTLNPEKKGAEGDDVENRNVDNSNAKKRNAGNNDVDNDVENSNAENSEADNNDSENSDAKTNNAEGNHNGVDSDAESPNGGNNNMENNEEEIHNADISHAEVPNERIRELAGEEIIPHPKEREGDNSDELTNMYDNDAPRLQERKAPAQSPPGAQRNDIENTKIREAPGTKSTAPVVESPKKHEKLEKTVKNVKKGVDEESLDGDDHSIEEEDEENEDVLPHPEQANEVPRLRERKAPTQSPPGAQRNDIENTKVREAPGTKSTAPVVEFPKKHEKLEKTGKSVKKGLEEESLDGDDHSIEEEDEENEDVLPHAEQANEAEDDTEAASAEEKPALSHDEGPPHLMASNAARKGSSAPCRKKGGCPGNDNNNTENNDNEE